MLLIAIAVCALVSSKDHVQADNTPRQAGLPVEQAPPLSGFAQDGSTYRTRVVQAGGRKTAKISRGASNTFARLQVRARADVPCALFIQDFSQDRNDELVWADLVPDPLIPGLGYGVSQLEWVSTRHYAGRSGPGTENFTAPDGSTHEVADSSEKTRVLDQIVGAGSYALSGPGVPISHQGRTAISSCARRHLVARGPPPLPI